MSRTLTLSAATLCLLVAFAVMSNAHNCNKLHAVFSFRQVDYWVFGPGYLVGINHYGRIVFQGLTSDIPFNLPITAAVGVPFDDTFYLESGKDEYGYKDWNEPSDFHPKYWTGADDELEKDPNYNGIDAAVLRGNHTYYFAGCNYVTADVYHMSPGTSGKLEDLNLPCNLDAAWKSPNGEISFIVKGDRLFVWHMAEDVPGREDNLYDHFTLLRLFHLCNH